MSELSKKWRNRTQAITVRECIDELEARDTEIVKALIDLRDSTLCAECHGYAYERIDAILQKLGVDALEETGR